MKVIATIQQVVAWVSQGVEIKAVLDTVDVITYNGRVIYEKK